MWVVVVDQCWPSKVHKAQWPDSDPVLTSNRQRSIWGTAVGSFTCRGFSEWGKTCLRQASPQAAPGLRPQLLRSWVEKCGKCPRLFQISGSCSFKSIIYPVFVGKNISQKKREMFHHSWILQAILWLQSQAKNDSRWKQNKEVSKECIL